MENSVEIFEIDEIYHFVERKGETETKESVYVLVMMRRNMRQIVDFCVSQDKSAATIQKLIDNSPPAAIYCTDGYVGYCDVDYFGSKHVRNVHNKKDTHNIESVNADLRHFIPMLRRRSRCFPRSIETLIAVIAVFVSAYNRFGLAKYRWRLSHGTGEPPFGLVNFLFAR